MKTYAFPGIIEDRILEIGARQIPYMRTPEFSAVNKDSERRLLDMVGCREGRVIIYTGSGTGAMDAVVRCYASTRGKAMVIDGGSFGHRWEELCRYYDVPCATMKVEFGKDVDYAALEAMMERERPGVLLFQHHETSSGQLFDVKRICGMCRRHGVSPVVDIISTFLAEPFDMDALGADIAITSSQKGLNIPPGLSVVFLSERLAGYDFARASYYFDFQDNLRNMERGQTPFSPATTIFLQLNERLRMIEAEGGVEANIARVRERAEIFRRLCREYGWRVAAENPSAAITGFYVNGSGQKVVRGLIEKYDTFVMPSGGHENFLRVSHMGLQTEDDLRELAAGIHEFEAE